MGRFRRALRDTAICLGMTVLAVACVVAAAEAYLRLTRPFLANIDAPRFVPDVGYLFEPGARITFTNQLDFWTTQQINSLGFADREPPDAPDATACRVALIGDSFVEALQVPLEEKVQTRLMELAPKLLPGTALVAAGYGISGTGQLNQLPFYDRYARAFRPNLIVLVFVNNDFANNSALLEAVRTGFDPQHPPRPYARRAADGSIEMMPADNAGWRAHLIGTGPSTGIIQRINLWLRLHSYFYGWVFTNLSLSYPRTAAWLQGFDLLKAQIERRDALARQPQYARMLDGFSGRVEEGDTPVTNTAVLKGAAVAVDEPFAGQALPPAFEEALAFTGFSLDEFVARARRDGAALVILSTENMRMLDQPEDRRFKRLKALADARGIPVIDLFDYIRGLGHEAKEASFAHDMHWSAQGHLWAAQALLGYIKAHPASCAQPAGRSAMGGASPGGGE